MEITAIGELKFQTEGNQCDLLDKGIKFFKRG